MAALASTAPTLTSITHGSPLITTREASDQASAPRKGDAARGSLRFLLSLLSVTAS